MRFSGQPNARQTAQAIILKPLVSVQYPSRRGFYADFMFLGETPAFRENHPVDYSDRVFDTLTNPGRPVGVGTRHLTGATGLPYISIVLEI
jgi:hypothetical protein